MGDHGRVLHFLLRFVTRTYKVGHKKFQYFGRNILTVELIILSKIYPDLLLNMYEASSSES